MAVNITMPQLSDTMDKGKILTWLKKEGDKVSRGDALAEVETDKADLEIESFHEGTLLKISAPEGTTVSVGELIAVVGEAGESVADAPASQPKATPAPAAAPQPEPEQPAPAAQPQPVVQQTPVAAPVAQPIAQASVAEEERVKISPLAKNIANSQGVDYRNINGSGEGGRIVKRDIEAAMGSQQPAPAPAPQPSQPRGQVVPITPQPVQREISGGAMSQPLSKMRTAIANRMVEATTTIPHFYMTSKINVDSLVSVRQSLKPLPQYEGITFTHMVIKAVALALHAHPRVNSYFQDGNLVQPQDVNIGIITALDDGLLIPVLKGANQLSLSDIVLESRALVQRARAGKPKGDDLSGATFCISNVGRYDVEAFTAVISPGNGGILAVGAIQEEPVVVDGELVIGQTMRVTVSVDHRIIDGVVAGAFVTELKRLIEDPVLLLA